MIQKLSLSTKPDAPEAAARWDAFWRGENSRPAVSAIVPRAGVRPVDNIRWYSILPEINNDSAIEQLIGWAETHEFLGEAFPFYYLEFAADHFSALLGADLIFKEGQRGGWAAQMIDTLHDCNIHFDPNNYWWRQTVALAEELQERCKDILLIAPPSLVANVDALAALYGSEKLLFAMIDEPDSVHRALEQIDRAHAEVLEALDSVFHIKETGSINRHGMFSAGRVSVTQCDLSCMIGPGLFDEFVRPYLQREMQRIDGVEYHLDGPGALKHLESLCSISKLDIIQWIAGAGVDPATDWTDLYKRIDSLGVGQLRDATVSEAETICQSLASKKIYIRLQAQSRDEVEDCLDVLETSTTNKR